MTTQSQSVFDYTFLAAADYTSSQYKFVYLTAANTVTVVDSTTDYPTGVLQNDPYTGQGATVRMQGTTKVVSDGSGTAITYWDPVRSDTSGRAVKAATGEEVIGRALTASSAAGTIIEIFLTPNGGCQLP